MALKITKASDAITVDRLNVVIYGPPGVGKSSLAFTADNPLLLDFDKGSHRAANRKDAVIVNDWCDVENITAEDIAGYDTIILDTAGRALDSLTANIIRANPKHGYGGALNQQGWGQLKTRFAAFLRLVNGFGKDVVLIAHMAEEGGGDDVRERLDMQGSSKNEVYKAADMMGRLVIEGRERWLRFSPTEAAFGKNPGQLDALRVPHNDKPEFAGFLAASIAMTKERLNALTEAQREASEEQAWFRTTLPGIEDADGINSIVQRAKDGGKATTALLVARAKELGLVADKEAGKYVMPVQEDEAA